MTSAQRMYLDGLWRALGIDPRADIVQVIELRVRLAAMQEIANGFADLKRAYDQPPKPGKR